MKRLFYFRRWFVLLLLCMGCLTSCGGEKLIYKDHPVEFDQKEANKVWSDERFLKPGIYEEQLFKEVKEGDHVYIIHGFQGGIWVHLSVRLSGVPSRGKIWASLGKEIGEIAYEIKLVRTAEGYLEAHDIPVPVKKEGDALKALYGTTTTLQVKYTADKKDISVSLKVILKQG